MTTNTSYVGHSFKIGAATTATEYGIEDSLIKFSDDGRFSCTCVNHGRH